MQPYYIILADTKDVTAALKNRLLSLSVNDAAGMDSDTLEITLDDRGGSIEIPRKGALLSVSMGYRETGLHPMGSFIADETVLSGMPSTMTIRAHSADFIESMKAKVTYSWDNATIGAICSTIAQRNGLEAHVSPKLAEMIIPHIDQTEESDNNFLTRLSTDRGASFKTAERTLLFVPKGESKSFDGNNLPKAALKLQQLHRYEVTYADRYKYSSAQAQYWDAAQAKMIPITVGSGAPVLFAGRYNDATSAGFGALAQLSAANRGLGTLSLECDGNTALMAETFMTLSGVRKGVDGEWMITQVAHRFDNRGYHCEVNAETPDPGEAKS